MSPLLLLLSCTVGWLVASVVVGFVVAPRLRFYK